MHDTPPQAIEAVVAKHDAAKQTTAELSKTVNAAREDLARAKRDNNDIKGRVATAQAALNRAEVSTGGGGGKKMKNEKGGYRAGDAGSIQPHDDILWVEYCAGTPEGCGLPIFTCRLMALCDFLASG